MKKLAFFGGSFNPPHIGHLGVINHLLKDKSIDLILMCPAFKHPEGKELEDIGFRADLCRRMTDHLLITNRIIVSEIERLNKSGLSCEAVTLVKRNWPLHSVSFVIGEDLKDQLNKWEGIEKLRAQVTEFITVPRTSHDLSFTTTRAALKQLYELLPRPVLGEIIKKEMYKVV